MQSSALYMYALYSICLFAFMVLTLFVTFPRLFSPLDFYSRVMPESCLLMRYDFDLQGRQGGCYFRVCLLKLGDGFRTRGHK